MVARLPTPKAVLAPRNFAPGIRQKSLMALPAPQLPHQKSNDRQPDAENRNEQSVLKQCGDENAAREDRRGELRASPASREVGSIVHLYGIAAPLRAVAFPP
jgi:hypothetical protein